jgi:hypothetical protein
LVKEMSMKKYSLVAAVVFGLTLCAKSWGLTTIDFDPPPAPGDLPAGLSAMSNSPGSPVPSNAQLSNQYEGDGVLFSSSDPFVAVVDVGSSVASPPNGIGGVTSTGLLSYADPITFTFVVPGTTTPGVTSSFAITADSDGISSQFATVSTFDSNGNLIQRQTLTDVGGETWSLSGGGIHTALFQFPTTSAGDPTTGSAFGSGTGIALDQLTFGAITPASGPSAVPLPRADWSALVMLGSLGVVWAIRSRQRRVTMSGEGR